MTLTQHDARDIIRLLEPNREIVLLDHLFISKVFASSTLGNAIFIDSLFYNHLTYDVLL